MGAIFSQSTFAALANAVENLLDNHAHVQVLTFYASLRELLRVFLRPLGDRVSVHTIRQNKGSQAPAVLLFAQPRYAHEATPEGSMQDVGKLVVAVSRARDAFWLLISCHMAGSKTWNSLYEAVRHDIAS